MATLEEKIEDAKKLSLQIVKDSEDDRLMTLSVGPQHPGSGHFRFVIKVDGDYIVYVDPDPGYVHRGHEKMCEYRNYFQSIPHLERPVIHDSCNITYSYSLGRRGLDWYYSTKAWTIYTRYCFGDKSINLYRILVSHLWYFSWTFYYVHVACR